MYNNNWINPEFFTRIIQSFEKMLENSRKHYNFIYIVCVISDPTNDDLIRLQEYLQSLNVIFIIDHSTKYIEEIERVNDERLNHKGYQNMADIYNNTKGQIQPIMSPTHHINYLQYQKPFGYIRQYHQLQIGIDRLLEYEEKHSFHFDICMRMRFDTCIKDNDFYPHCPEKDVLSKLTFNDYILTKLRTKMVELNIDTIEEYAKFVKNNPITVPEMFSSYPETSFGSLFFNNYISIENISRGQENILYCFWDHLFFGKRDTFVKLRNFFNEYGKIESTLNQNGMSAFFCPECQLLLYCFHNNINPLMYMSHIFETLK